jgi:hypothetical protein
VAELLDDHGNWKEQLVNQTFRPIDATEILKIKSSSRMMGDDGNWRSRVYFLYVALTSWLSMNYLSNVPLALLVIGQQGMTRVGQESGRPMYLQK